MGNQKGVEICSEPLCGFVLLGVFILRKEASVPGTNILWEYFFTHKNLDPTRIMNRTVLFRSWLFIHKYEKNETRILSIIWSVRFRSWLDIYS